MANGRLKQRRSVFSGQDQKFLLPKWCNDKCKDGDYHEKEREKYEEHDPQHGTGTGNLRMRFYRLYGVC